MPITLLRKVLGVSFQDRSAVTTVKAMKVRKAVQATIRWIVQLPS